MKLWEGIGENCIGNLTDNFENKSQCLSGLEFLLFYS